MIVLSHYYNVIAAYPLKVRARAMLALGLRVLGGSEAGRICTFLNFIVQALYCALPVRR